MSQKKSFLDKNKLVRQAILKLQIQERLNELANNLKSTPVYTGGTVKH